VPIFLLLHDNRGYGEIKSAMLAARVSPVGVDILTPDIAAIAEACGWKVARINRFAELPPLLTYKKNHGAAVMVIFGDELRTEAAAFD
jgi:acetolactate synthase-1/2/3 large subunit